VTVFYAPFYTFLGFRAFKHYVRRDNVSRLSNRPRRGCFTVGPQGTPERFYVRVRKRSFNKRSRNYRRFSTADVTTGGRNSDRFVKWKNR